MQLHCTRKPPLACRRTILSFLSPQSSLSPYTAVAINSRCAFKNPNSTPETLFRSLHRLNSLTCIQQQHQSKFQTPHLKAAQSNPDLQPDPSGPLRSLIRYAVQLACYLVLKSFNLVCSMS
jgi:hypothetical protein